ncbi:NnrU family protein [Rhizobium sp. SG2393]|uniref:NnrU family protein n=1 Tax=Rhizobium sp. SG2393 TaxID=3276279 RepID=UPI00366AA587
MAILVLGIVIFLVTHLVPAFGPGLRDRVIANHGNGVWYGVHGAGSILGVLLIAYGFSESRLTTGMLYTPPTFLAHITLTLMLLACICLVAAFLPPGKIRAVLKFPGLVAIKIWAFSHLLANGETNSVLLFTTFLAWAVIVRIRKKRQVRAGLIAYPVFVSYRYDLMALIGGAVLYVLILLKLHLWLIGVSPIVMG